MSAALGAALKKIAVALLTDRRNWEKLAVALFAVLLLFLLPILSVEAIFQADMDWDSPELVSTVLEELDVGSLGFLESSNSVLTQLQEALKAAGFGFEEFRKAQALYWLALSPYAEEADFIEKLVGCFAPEQTNEELVANVNAAFGTDIDPEEFEKILATTASDMVAIAQSQIGQTGGQPYWSWYGFGSRVEWCAIFVSWCANQCGYIDAGIVPKFAGCGVGVQWFQNRGQWLPGSATPEPGMLIFFQWYGSDSSIADHVGIVERVENGRVYTIEGNADDQVRQNSYPIGYGEIKGTVCRLQTREDDDYKTAGLFAAPPQPGRELLTEFGYYTLTKQDIQDPTSQAWAGALGDGQTSVL